MSLRSLSHRVLAMKFWQRPGFSKAHSFLAKPIPRQKFEVYLQGSFAFFLLSSIVAVTAIRRRYAYLEQVRHNDMIRHELATNPGYAMYAKAANAHYTERLAGGAAAAYPYKPKQ
mmetsp:Transcript_849/g.1487  ORF Transcript_849/g.1487 Transcript_849/m.1487 type:complete len:115 (-) Transcript_849:257-601(-)